MKCSKTWIIHSLEIQFVLNTAVIQSLQFGWNGNLTPTLASFEGWTSCPRTHCIMAMHVESNHCLRTHRIIAMQVDSSVPKNPYVGLVKGEQVIRVHMASWQCTSKQTTICVHIASLQCKLIQQYHKFSRQRWTSLPRTHCITAMHVRINHYLRTRCVIAMHVDSAIPQIPYVSLVKGEQLVHVHIVSWQCTLKQITVGVHITTSQCTSIQQYCKVPKLVSLEVSCPCTHCIMAMHVKINHCWRTHRNIAMHVDPAILQSPYVGLVEGEKVFRIHIASWQCTSKQITVGVHIATSQCTSIQQYRKVHMLVSSKVNKLSAYTLHHGNTRQNKSLLAYTSSHCNARQSRNTTKSLRWSRWRWTSRPSTHRIMAMQVKKNYCWRKHHIIAMHVDPEIPKNPYVGLVKGEQVVCIHIASWQCTSKKNHCLCTHCVITMHVNSAVLHIVS